MVVNKTIVKIAVIEVIFIAALVSAIIHVNSLDPNCPYCDIDELNKHGGTLEYTEGSENKTFVLEGGYRRGHR